MKRVVMLVILYSVLLLCSIACEARTAIKNVYKEDKNTIEIIYEQFHEYVLNDDTKGFFTLNMQKATILDLDIVN